MFIFLVKHGAISGLMATLGRNRRNQNPEKNSNLRLNGVVVTSVVIGDMTTAPSRIDDRI